VVLIVRGYAVALVLLYLALVWMQTADWLGRRSLFTYRNKTPIQIYREARQGNLSLPAPANYISRASIVLLVAGGISFFVN